MARKIRKISLSLDKLCGEATAAQMGLVMKLVNNYVDPINVINWKTYPALGDFKVVGRDEDMSFIVNKLVNSNNETNLSVISIVGMPGQGKTTLAKLIYKNELVIKHFPRKMWICVSNNFDVTKILNEMVESISKVDATFTHLSNIEALTKKLKTLIRDMRYLLVLDDVWNADPAKWESMSDSLKAIGGSKGSKIMITTKNMNVASTMKTYLDYPLKGLSDEDSWTMFKQIAFAKGGPLETKELVNMGKDIVGTCKGLPLAVKTAGGLLYSKKSAHEWGQMLESLEHVSGKVLLNLKLSYDNLESPSLKHCFTSCSFFPKGFNIEKNKLIQIWKALGLLNSPEGNDLVMEDMGNYYFDTLLFNSLLQDENKDKFENITTCKMHDLVHDLALDISKKTLWKSRALFIKDDIIGNTLNDFSRLYVLNLVNNGIETLPGSLEEMRQLRYLNISQTKSLHKLQLPDMISSLINLRNIYIYGMNEFKIPTLGHLPFLEVIEIGDAENVKVIGGEFYGKHFGGGAIFPSLRVLTLKLFPKLVEWFECRLPSAKIVFPYLEKLSIYWCSELRIVPTIFPSLKELITFGVDSNIAFSGLSSQLTSLTSLCMDGMKRSENPSMNRFLKNNKLFRKLSFYHSYELTFIPPLHDLKELKLVNCSDLNSLPNLPSLETLHINGSGLSEIHALSSIRTLKIYDCPSLTHIIDLPGAFSNMEELQIQNCKSLRSFPHLETLTSIRMFHITNCEQFEIIYTELPTSLDELHIEKRFASPDPYLQYVRMLELSEDGDCFQWPSTSTSDFDIQNIEQLRVVGKPNIKSLPEQLQHFSSLTFLDLKGFDGLEALPEWLGNLSSLEYLYITGCPNLKSMPLLESMQRLTNLKRLHVLNCPLLTKMCIEGLRPEWNKISHIPHIEIQLKQ